MFVIDPAKELERLIEILSDQPFEPTLNFSIAIQYLNMGQTASAVSFFLRTSEYGYDTHRDYVYCSLIMAAKCFRNQKGRDTTVKNLILKAIDYSPYRPEAYFWLSRWHEEHGQWQESYSFATVGISMRQDYAPLPVDLEFNTLYLRFERAVSGWQIGRQDEAIQEFKSLYKENMIPLYHEAVINNFNNLAIAYLDEPLEILVNGYRKSFGEKASLIVDIGTRDGDDALYLFETLKGEKVLAIEARPSGAELTRNNYPWFDVRQTAVSDTVGVTTFYEVVSDDKEAVGTSSIFYKREPELNALAVVSEVPLTRMDILLKDYLGFIDIVKIDVEGLTWQVLQGFGERLQDVKVFHLETEKEQITPAHVTTAGVSAFMIEKGFTLVDRYYEWGPNIEDQVWVNTNLLN